MTRSQRRQDGRKLRVLVADDDRNVRAALQLLLSQERAVTAMDDTTSAEDMVRTAVLGRPDVIFLDLGLPGLDGESLGVIRACLPDVTIIGMATRHEEMAPQAQEIDAVIDKMDGAGALLAALRAVVARPVGGAGGRR